MWQTKRLELAENVLHSQKSTWNTFQNFFWWMHVWHLCCRQQEKCKNLVWRASRWAPPRGYEESRSYDMVGSVGKTCQRPPFRESELYLWEIQKYANLFCFPSLQVIARRLYFSAVECSSALGKLSSNLFLQKASKHWAGGWASSLACKLSQSDPLPFPFVGFVKSKMFFTPIRSMEELKKNKSWDTPNSSRQFD